MAKNLTQYSIFLSSPSDVTPERDEFPHVIQELNQTYGKSNNINFELLKWDINSAPGIAENYTQELINSDIGDDYDIFIGIIWKKFGTKTQVASSGTEEEFLRALQRFKNGENIQILFYFKKESIPVDEIIPQDILKINEFKENLKDNNVLFWNFNNVEELKNQLRIHIPKRTDNLIKNAEGIIEIIKTDDLSLETVPIIDSNEFGILDFIIQFEDFMANANLALNAITDATNLIGEEFKNKTDEIEKLKKLPNFNKNQVVAILGRTAKIVDNYTDRLSLETPIYLDNFELSIKVASLYLNNINKENIGNNVEDLDNLIESVRNLKSNIPLAINGMQGFYTEIVNLPNIYSVFSKSKNKLILQLDEFQSTLKSSFDLTHELEGEIEYKLSFNKGN